MNGIDILILFMFAWGIFKCYEIEAKEKAAENDD